LCRIRSDILANLWQTRRKYNFKMYSYPIQTMRGQAAPAMMDLSRGGVPLVRVIRREVRREY